MPHDSFAAANREAWNTAAAKYGPELERHVAMLRAGESSLLPVERDALSLGDGWCECAVHLQCSFGLDTLSLWVAGAARVIGVDISPAMLDLARAAGDAVSAPASWITADVLELPPELRDSADLVYTGKGALPWVFDLDRWASAVHSTLRPGGLLYVYEGHPLDWVWEPEASTYAPRRDGRGYFDRDARENADFPASFLARAKRSAPAGEGGLHAYERQWTLGDIVNAVRAAGLYIERFDEYPDPFWRRFPHLDGELLRRLPHSFALQARKPVER